MLVKRSTLSALSASCSTRCYSDCVKTKTSNCKNGQCARLGLCAAAVVIGMFCAVYYQQNKLKADIEEGTAKFKIIDRELQDSLVEHRPLRNTK